MRMWFISIEDWRRNYLTHNLENYDCACILRIRKHHLNGCLFGAGVVCGNEKGKQLSIGKVWWKLIEFRFIVVVTMKKVVA